MKSVTVAEQISYRHLSDLTDHQGLFEHALLDKPRVEHGYCVDDVARAMVVVLREPAPDEELRRLLEVYLRFVTAAVRPDGQVHNRMSVLGDWTDEASDGDWWGRAIWSLGHAAHYAPTTRMRQQAFSAFIYASQHRPTELMPRVFAALGAAEVLAVLPANEPAASLLSNVAATAGHFDIESGWPWPEPRLRYSNGHVVEALLVAGANLPDLPLLRRSLLLLDFLVEQSSGPHHLSPVPVGGRGAGDVRPAFDQQPIEVAAVADAAARAFDLTHDVHWRHVVAQCWRWFLGDNDAGLPMIDRQTGAGFDGLEASGRNENRGAESTLAALSTAQHAIRLGAFE